MPDSAPSSQPWAACCSSIASARNNVTSGVAIPSFSPLSMFSARRIRTGTRRSVKIGSPNAASVGARMAPIKSAKPSPSPGKQPERRRAAQEHSQGHADQQEPRWQPGVLSHLAQVERGGVGEQQQGQRSLGDALHVGGRDRDVDESEHTGTDDRPRQDEHQWHRHREAPEPRGKGGAEDDDRQDQRPVLCAHRLNPSVFAVPTASDDPAGAPGAVAQAGVDPTAALTTIGIVMGTDCFWRAGRGAG